MGSKKFGTKKVVVQKNIFCQKILCHIQGCFHLEHFGGIVVVLVVVVTGGKKSTPSPRTEVWTLDWSLTILN